MAGFFHWARRDSIDEAVIWWSENCGSSDPHLCYTEMWPCSILSLWWDRCCTWPSIQNSCWKYPNSLFLSDLIFLYNLLLDDNLRGKHLCFIEPCVLWISLNLLPSRYDSSACRHIEYPVHNDHFPTWAREGCWPDLRGDPQESGEPCQCCLPGWCIGLHRAWSITQCRMRFQSVFLLVSGYLWT